MPFIHVRTNVEAPDIACELAKQRLGHAVEALPGKSEAWLMVEIDPAAYLWFQGSYEPAAMVTVSLYGGAPEEAYDDLTSRITEILSGIPSILFGLFGYTVFCVMFRMGTSILAGCLTMTLTQEEFEALDLRLESGSALAGVTYTGTPEQLNFSSSPRVTVTKTMDTPEDQKHLGGETTVIIQVDLNQDMPYGQYQLVEWIPSNMRLRGVEEPEDAYNPFPFSWSCEEQLLTVDFYYGEDTGTSFTFRYTATSVLDTECTLERAYAYHLDTMEGSWTEKGEFLPSDYYYLGVGYLFRKD